jgi:VanZ family protein
VTANVEAVTQPKLRFAWLWWALAWLLVAATVNESLQRNVWAVAEVFPSDKVTHFAGYCALAIWFGGIVRRSRYFVVAAFLLALGGGLEIAQGLMNEGRTADWFDMLANTLGVCTGLGVSALGLGYWMVWIERLFRLQK